MRSRLVLAVLCLAAAMSLAACGGAVADASGKLALRKVGEFDQPVYVAGAPGFPKLLFVVEQEGEIIVLRDGKAQPKPFLDLRDQVGYNGAERGLLSVAFAPDYASSGRFYVYYVDHDGKVRIDELRRTSPTLADPSSQRSVISIPHPNFDNHNGGQMEFLGQDLYFATGDGGSGGDPPNNAQNKNVLLGKLLRIDPRPSGGEPYSIPASNPFVGAAGRDEIYSYGLRNPFRFSFDLTTSPGHPRIAIGDVGQSNYEEVDYTTVPRARGANFGWDALEGFKPYEGENSGTPDPGGTTKPIFAYSHSRDGSCSIIGGYVVADRTLPSLYGRYVYADYCEGELRALTPHLKGATGDHKLGLAVTSPTSFGEDESHHLYVASQDGSVYRLVEK